MNPKNHLPEGLTPYEATLYAYLTDPTRTLTDPRDFHDRAGVHYAANHGPRTPEHARHILANPHLIRLLTELWNEEPPTPQLLDQLNQTPEGRELLAAGRPTPSDPEDTIDDVVVSDLLIEIELFLLGVEAFELPGMRSSNQASPTSAGAKGQRWVYYTAGGKHPVHLDLIPERDRFLFRTRSSTSSAEGLAGGTYTLTVRFVDGSTSASPPTLHVPGRRTLFIVTTEQDPDDVTGLTLTPIRPTFT